MSTLDSTGRQAFEADVVVIGYGAAGAAAAITAHDHGARVLIIEKMPAGGGNSLLSSGILITATGPGAYKYVETLCFNKTSSDIIHAYVDGCAKLENWLNELGGQLETYQYVQALFSVRTHHWPNVPGLEDIATKIVGGPDAGQGFRAKPLWTLLTGNVERRKIPVWTNTSSKDLITDDKGAVIGVVAEREGRQISIAAKKAVILTCGSFEFNEEMKDAYLPLTPLHAIGNPGNTGDGILMAQKIGAALWHMSAFYGWWVFKTPEYPTAFSINFHAPGFVYVNKDGLRFTTETDWESHQRSKSALSYMPQRSNYPHLPAYAIFDDMTRRKGPLVGRLAGTNNYQWSLDNSKETAKGWISQGKTIGELANRIAVDEATLVKTIARYNEYCKAGADADFGRARETLEPIAVGPFYAIELWPGIATASGGPRRDKEARVVSTAGKPIPRLYEAGGIGSIWGFLTLAGGGLTDGMVFGQIAGRNAAAEEPWN